MTDTRAHGGSINGSGSENSLQDFFILRITNQKDKTGYVAKVDEKLVISLKLIPEVVRFEQRNTAKELGKQFRNCKVEILDRAEVEKVLAKEGAEITVPVSDMDVDVYHITVKDKVTCEQWGYLTYNRGTDEYSIVKTTEGAAFWNDELSARSFIESAHKVIQSNMPNLVLEPKVFNKHSNSKIITEI